MVDGPTRRIAWRILDAQYFGLAQRRERVFVVACPRDGADPAEILFEREGLQRHSPPRREAGQTATGTISARTQGGGGLGTDFECQGGLVPEVSMCLNAGAMGRIDGESETFVAEVSPTLSKESFSPTKSSSGQMVDFCIAHARRAEGFDASEDGSGRGTPIVPVAFTNQWGDDVEVFSTLKADCNGALPMVAFSCKDHGADASDIAPTLRSMGHDGSHANGGGQVAVAFHENQRHELTLNDTAGSLKCNGGKPGQGYPAILTGAEEPYTLAIRGRGDGHQLEARQDGTANALMTPNGGRGGIGVGAVAHLMAVRRLTPVECERLQGFPDSYSAITFRGKPAADGNRYKALGNSMAVPVIAWIGNRIRQVSR